MKDCLVSGDQGNGEPGLPDLPDGRVELPGLPHSRHVPDRVHGQTERRSAGV